MGQVIEKVVIKNLFDIEKFENGEINVTDVRNVSINAIVDTGASYLCLPPKVIQELGLKYSRSSKVRTGNGIIELKFFKGGEIYLRDRFTQLPIMEKKKQRNTAINRSSCFRSYGLYC